MIRLPLPAPLPDAAGITSAAAELVARAERSEAVTARPPRFVARTLTTAIREAMRALLAVGVVVQLGLGREHGRTCPVVRVSGNSLPCRDELRAWGARYHASQRSWSLHGDVDLSVLLPRLLAAHDAHESASQRRAS